MDNIFRNPMEENNFKYTAEIKANGIPNFIGGPCPEFSPINFIDAAEIKAKEIDVPYFTDVKIVGANHLMPMKITWVDEKTNGQLLVFVDFAKGVIYDKDLNVLDSALSKEIKSFLKLQQAGFKVIIPDDLIDVMEEKSKIEKDEQYGEA